MSQSSFTAFVGAFFTILTLVVAQSQGFIQYPSQVIDGQSYPVSWEAGGAQVTVDVLKGGVRQETVFFGTGTGFNWVIDEEDGDTNYALRLTIAGSTTAPIISGPIWIIEDEDGLLVNGQTIRASISGGPSSSGLVSTAAPSATGSSVASNSGATSQLVRTETLVFTAPQTTASFTRTITAATTGASLLPETLTFTTGSLIFTTTIASTSVPTSSSTAAAASGGGLSGGAIAGIVVAVVVVLFVILGYFAFRWRRKTQRSAREGGPESPITAFISGGRRALSDRKSQRHSTDAAVLGNEKRLSSDQTPLGSSELAVDNAPVAGNRSSVQASELAGVSRHEMSASQPMFELPAEEVPRTDPGQQPAVCRSVSSVSNTNEHRTVGSPTISNT